MIKKHAFVVLLIPSIFFAQQERYPIFDVCKGSQIQSLKDCFYTTTRKYFFWALIFAIHEYVSQQRATVCATSDSSYI